MCTSTQVKILVVDDDTTLLDVFSTALSHVGYDVSTASSGRAALEQFGTQPADVVLLDINLPDVSGIEVMHQVIRTAKAIVILITGYDEHYSHELAVREGAADFIVKPVRLGELLLRIRQALELRQLAKAKEQLIAELERLAIHDELTGLFNYRSFRDQLRAEVERAQRYGRPVSLILLDADNLKGVNDTRGHAAGDGVLVGVAKILCTYLRATDKGFRCGGDEFAALLPETPLSEALTVAQRILAGIQHATLQPALTSTISVGVAELLSGDDAATFLRRADDALYAAKNAGRNRVVTA